MRPGRRVRPGARLVFGGGLFRAEVKDVTPAGGRIVSFFYEGVFEDLLRRLGEMPLPPYIKERLDDPERYQTVYAREEGSKAAPTAGLHFTPELLETIRSQGIVIAPLTLHVGLGTFRPVSTETVEAHTMHAEFYRLPEATADAVNRASGRGGRVVAVGTTAVRTLETRGRRGRPGPGRARGGPTSSSIRVTASAVVDALVTNFHLPRSTLLMLVCAFAGGERMLAAYRDGRRGGVPLLQLRRRAC